jgi:hypothetical protein
LAHACDQALAKLRQEVLEFKAWLNCTVRFCQRKGMGKERRKGRRKEGRKERRKEGRTEKFLIAGYFSHRKLVVISIYFITRIACYRLCNPY